MTEPTDGKLCPPQQKRRQFTEQRLRTALERLVAGTPRTKSLRKTGYRLTVTVLAREANVSRNTIYANHRSFVDELVRQAGRSDAATPPSQARNAREDRRLIAELRENIRDLASQNAALLKRAIDAEKQARHLAARNAFLTSEIATLRAPAVVSRED
jgi:DNA-binding transcriptional regulator PaaX